MISLSYVLIEKEAHVLGKALTLSFRAMIILITVVIFRLPSERRSKQLPKI